MHAVTEILEWMTKGKHTLIQKDPLKGTALTNYRPITCLLMMLKIWTAQIREEICNSLISCGNLHEEQKGCSQRTRGTEELLDIDHPPPNESKTRRKNLAIAWSYYKKSLRYGPAKLDTTLSQTVQTVQFIEKPCKLGEWNWQQEDKIRRKNPKMHIPKRCIITITICDSHDATQPHH